MLRIALLFFCMLGFIAAEVQAVAAKYFGDDQLTVATLLPQPIDPNRKPRAATPGARH